MQGRKRFSSEEASDIRRLLSEKEHADRNEQKVIRAALRRIGFYIRDFDQSNQGFLVEDFDALVSTGGIDIRL